MTLWIQVSIRVIIAGVLFCLFSQPALTGTVAGKIEGVTHWTEEMNPIEISGVATLPRGATLTITAGARILFSTGSHLQIEGCLDAAGESGDPIHLAGGGLIRFEGVESTGVLSNCEFVGPQVEVFDRATCRIEKCSFRNMVRAVFLDGASAPAIHRTTFENVGTAIESLDSSPHIEGCRFENIHNQAMIVEGQGMDYAPPAELRVRGPRRMAAGKTTTLWIETIDSEGNLYWPLWEGTGAATAWRTSDGQAVSLSVDSFRVTNGIGCLTTSISETGNIEIEISVKGLSAVHRVESISIEDNRTFAVGVLPSGDQVWKPSGGVYHLTGRVVVNPGTRLILEAGTLLMMDPHLEIEVYGDIEIRGTEENPVYFFPNDPLRPWDQLRIRNTNKFFNINHAYFTGGSDGPKETAEEHTFDGPMLRFRPHDDVTQPKGGRIEGCLFADALGKGVFTHDGERFEVVDCLFARLNFGLEMHGDHVHIQNSQVIQMNPRSGEPNEDKDGMYLWRPTKEHLIEQCIVTGTGDDGIDAFESSVVIKNCLLYGSYDKNVTFFLSDGDVQNCLVFGSRYGLFFREAPGKNHLTVNQCTVLDHATHGIRIENMVAKIENSVLWNNVSSLFHFGVNLTVNHTDVDSNLSGIAGTGNLSMTPDFYDPESNDFRLTSSSPLRSAGNLGQPIGWLGYPEPGVFPPRSIPIILDCRLRNGSGAAVVVGEQSPIKMTGNLIEGFSVGIDGKMGSTIEGERNTLNGCDLALSLDSSHLEFHSSILWNHSEILRRVNSPVAFAYCNIGPAASTLFPGEGNLNSDPLFFDPDHGDYRLQPDSPCAGTGLAGVDRGALPALSGAEKSLLQLY